MSPRPSLKTAAPPVRSLTLLLALAASCQALAGTGSPASFLSEGFDLVAVTPGMASPPNPDGSCPLNAALAGWYGKNNGTPPLGITCLFQGNLLPSFPAQSGAADSYIAANFEAITGTSPISTFLVTPRLMFGPEASLSFQFRSANNAMANFPDRVQVLLSTAADAGTPDVGTGPAAVGTFTVVLADINPTQSSTFVSCPTGGFVLNTPASTIAGTVADAWCEVRINAGAGFPTSGSGRIAFRHVISDTANNGNYIGIDSFSYSDGTSLFVDGFE